MMIAGSESRIQLEVFIEKIYQPSSPNHPIVAGLLRAVAVHYKSMFPMYCLYAFLHDENGCDRKLESHRRLNEGSVYIVKHYEARLSATDRKCLRCEAMYKIKENRCSRCGILYDHVGRVLKCQSTIKSLRQPATRHFSCR